MRRRQKEVWVLVYTHRFGTDISVHSTEKRAVKDMASACYEFYEELPTARQRAFLKLIKAQEYKKAAEHYIKHHEDHEHYEILPRKIDGQRITALRL